MATSSTVRKHLTRAQRAQLLRTLRKSGLSQRAFAVQAGIGRSTLQLWLCARRGKPVAVPQFEALPNRLAAPAAGPYRLCWAKGLVLELGRGLVAEELAMLLQLLEGRCSR